MKALIILLACLSVMPARAAAPDFSVKGIVKMLQDPNRQLHDIATTWIAGVIAGATYANADLWLALTGKQFPSTCKRAPSANDAAGYLQLPTIYSKRGDEGSGSIVRVSSAGLLSLGGEAQGKVSRSGSPQIAEAIAEH